MKRRGDKMLKELSVKQLEQAEKYQKSARPIKCMMVLMLCVE